MLSSDLYLQRDVFVFDHQFFYLTSYSLFISLTGASKLTERIAG